MSRDGKARKPKATAAKPRRTIADLSLPIDPLAAMIANDVSEMRAGIERLVELATAQGQRMQRHLEMFEEHLDAVGEHKIRQGETTRALSALVNTLASHTDLFSGTVREAVESLAAVISTQAVPPPWSATKSLLHVSDIHMTPGNHDMAAAVLDPVVRPDPEDIVTESAPAPAHTVEPVPPVLARRRTHAVVSSTPIRRRIGHYLTRICIEYDLWYECGFKAKDRLNIRREGAAVVITRDSNGITHRIGKNCVTLQTTRLGDFNYERLNVLAGPGKIML